MRSRLGVCSHVECVRLPAAVAAAAGGRRKQRQAATVKKDPLSSRLLPPKQEVEYLEDKLSKWLAPKVSLTTGATQVPRLLLQLKRALSR